MEVKVDPVDEVSTVTVTDEILSDFPTFVENCVNAKVSRGKGVFKARLAFGEQRVTSCPDLVKQLHSAAIMSGYLPQEQLFEAHSSTQNLFNFMSLPVGKKTEEMIKFTQLMLDPKNFEDVNYSCCSPGLLNSEGDWKCLMAHFFEKVRSASFPKPNLKEERNASHYEKMLSAGKKLKEIYFKNRTTDECSSSDPHPWTEAKRSISNLNEMDSSSGEEYERQISNKNKKKKRRTNIRGPSRESRNKTKKVVEVETLKGIIYGAGIELPPFNFVNITKGFTLSKLKTILDILEEKYPGLASCYFYIGYPHSLAPAHTEDKALWSVNFLHFGSVKVWIVIPPDFVWLIPKCLLASGFKLEHSSCWNFLGHKCAVFDLEFLQKHKIPYSVVIQKPGEFVFLEPNAVHLVFNAGFNIAESINFATESWITTGLYAPICKCLKGQIKFSMDIFLATFREDLLKPYDDGQLYTFDSSATPTSERVCMQFTKDDSTGNHQLYPVKNLKSHQDTDHPQDCRQLPSTSQIKKTKRKLKTFSCLACNKEYKEKMGRLLTHCEIKHPFISDLVDRTKEKYTDCGNKLKKNLMCPICQKLFAGRPANLRLHIYRVHSQTTADDVSP